mgnify:FL=1
MGFLAGLSLFADVAGLAGLIYDIVKTETTASTDDIVEDISELSGKIDRLETNITGEIEALETTLTAADIRQNLTTLATELAAFKALRSDVSGWATDVALFRDANGQFAPLSDELANARSRIDSESRQALEGVLSAAGALTKTVDGVPPPPEVVTAAIVTTMAAVGYRTETIATIAPDEFGRDSVRDGLARALAFYEGGAFGGDVFTGAKQAYENALAARTETKGLQAFLGDLGEAANIGFITKTETALGTLENVYKIYAEEDIEALLGSSVDWVDLGDPSERFTELGDPSQRHIANLDVPEGFDPILFEELETQDTLTVPNGLFPADGFEADFYERPPPGEDDWTLQLTRYQFGDPDDPPDVSLGEVINIYEKELLVDAAFDLAGLGVGGTGIDAAIADLRQFVTGAQISGDARRGDDLVGTEGKDYLLGLGGDDAIDGGADDDTLIGGTGDDDLADTQGRNWLDGDDGADTLTTGPFEDRLVGGAGDDTLDSGYGDDVLIGGAGNDVLVGGVLPSEDLAGLGGTDTALFSGPWSEYALTPNGDGSLALLGPDGRDRLESVEILMFEDRVVNVVSGAAQISGSARSELIFGSDQGDFIYPSDGEDTIEAGAGDDQILLEPLPVFRFPRVVDGGEGTDRVRLAGEEADYVFERQFDGQLRVTSRSPDAPAATLLANVELALLDAGDIDLVARFPERVLLQGGPEADSLEGAEGDDSLEGGEGDDTLSGAAGDDTLEGGGGADAAVFSGAQSSYTVQVSASGVAVQDRREGGDGTDLLAGVETLAFDGRDWPLSWFSGVGALSEDVFRDFVEVYLAYFNRAPDAEGLLFYGTAFAGGTSLERSVETFLDSDEYRAAYPDGQANAEFATSVYDNVLGRIPDPDGFDFWVGLLDAGRVGRDTFILEVLQGAKAEPKEGATQDFIDQQRADREYLADKTDIGVYFAVTKGMSDVDAAAAAMELFDGSPASLSAAKDAIDSVYADAIDPENGAFLLQLVGVVDDPFAAA